MFGRKNKKDEIKNTSPVETPKKDIHERLYPIRYITKYLLEKKDIGPKIGFWDQKNRWGNYG